MTKTGFHLEGEIAALKMIIDAFAKEAYEKDLKIARLEIELAESKKDAERYSWFRRNHETYIPNKNSPSLWGCKGQDYSLKTLAALDSAIDCAMDAILAAKEQA